MSKLERARRFLTGRTRAIALKVIPLALLAGSAYAAGISSSSFTLDSQNVNFNNSVNSSGSVFSSGSFLGSLSGLENGFFGLSVTGTVDVVCSGNCSGDTIDFNFSGSVFPQLPAMDLVGFVFTTTLDGGTKSGSYNWSVTGQGNASLGSGSGSFGDTQQGSGTMAGGSDWSVDLYVTPQNFTNGDVLTLTLPSDQTPASIDINAASPTPEPDSIALALVGTGALLFLRRKRTACTGV